MMDSFDYPGAHSMDTMWFAVDRDGHVAAFNSGEAGAVPEQANIGEDYGVFVDLLRARIDPRPIQYVLAGHESSNTRHLPEWPVLVFVGTREAVNRLLDGGGREVAATDAFAVVVPANAAQRQLHERGECLASIEYREGHEDSEYGVRVAARGLYYYDHLSRDAHFMAIAGPYGLQAQPSRPITVAELPDEFREVLVPFSGRFEDFPRLQPAEHWRSAAWGPAFFTVDRKHIGPLPERLRDYGKEYPALVDAFAAEGVEIAAPDGTREAATAPKKPWWRFW